MGFFDKFPRFYTTSHTSPYPHRLNSRYEAIIAKNADRLAGKRVLDIASHDGRWTFAALSAGAAHVTGAEPRRELIDNAESTFAEYGIDTSRYNFISGDIFDVLHGQRFDVVLCLGFYYHTIRHAELLDRIERTAAKLVVIDTEVTPKKDELPPYRGDDPLVVFRNPYAIQLRRERVDSQELACSDSMTRGGYTLVGRPSREAMKLMASHFGFSLESFAWLDFLKKHREAIPDMKDYYATWRDTFYLSR
jgi:hypothetical protein